MAKNTIIDNTDWDVLAALLILNKLPPHPQPLVRYAPRHQIPVLLLNFVRTELRYALEAHSEGSFKVFAVVFIGAVHLKSGLKINDPLRPEENYRKWIQFICYSVRPFICAVDPNLWYRFAALFFIEDDEIPNYIEEKNKIIDMRYGELFR